MSEEAWSKLAAAAAAARAEVLAAAPDAETAAEGEAYIARVVAASLGATVLGHLFAAGNLGRALPTYGGPNPDYIMQHAGIDPALPYRLEGRLNGSERVGVGLYAVGTRGETIERGYTAFDSSNCAPDGSFTLALSPDGSVPGSFAIPPDVRILLMRTLHRNSGAQAAQLLLRGGTQLQGLSLVTGTPEGALGRAAGNITNSVHQFLAWTQATSANPNRLAAPPPGLAEQVQGDRDTQYYLGYYLLEQGEWLEVTIPGNLPGYWSLHAYNHWCEGLQTQGAHDRNAKPDGDGRIRVRVGPNVPEGLANRIDTLRRRRGVLICRIIGGRPGGLPPTAMVQR